MDWFLYNKNLSHESGKEKCGSTFVNEQSHKLY